MAKRIALFNHKGGVSKTTTTFHLSWMLAQKGYRVLMVDADSQCNLTGLILGEKFEQFYEEKNPNNLKDAVNFAFKARPRIIKAVECQSIKEREGLFLLPGHLNLSEYEITLGLAQSLSNAIYTLQNIPGAFSYLFEETAKKYDIDYILIDLNPSLGAINQNLVMTSDYFLIPTSADFFSVMALESMATVLPQWYHLSKKAMSMEMLTEDATYPLPKIIPKFLGVLIQKYALDNVEPYKPVKRFQVWIDKINDCVVKKLVPALATSEMMLNEKRYQNNYSLAGIPDYTNLGALHQNHRVPIFTLNENQINNTGNALANAKARCKKFEIIYSELADQIIELTSNGTNA